MTTQQLDPWAEHHRARSVLNTVSRAMLHRAQVTGPGEPYTLKELAGNVIVNTRPPGVRRPAWALWCGYVALTGRRPPAWWERLTRAPR